MKTIKNYMAKVAINKSLLKEYSNSEFQRIVYINDGQEFQIQLFNPKPFTVGVDISINGIPIGNTFIIRPGQRVWLERYFNTPYKFKFNTYFVHAENTDVKEAIANNGVITLQFYKEKEFNNDWWKKINSSSWTYYNKYPEWTSFTTSASDMNINNINSNINNCYTQTTFASTLDSNSVFNETTGEINVSGVPKFSYNKTYYSNDNKIETGRIEKGDYSNQKFDTVNVDLEDFPFAYETIKILPESQKQVNANDLKKLYCHECGRKIKDNFKFCPYCGAKLN